MIIAYLRWSVQSRAAVGIWKKLLLLTGTCLRAQQDRAARAGGELAGRRRALLPFPKAVVFVPLCLTLLWDGARR